MTRHPSSQDDSEICAATPSYVLYSGLAFIFWSMSFANAGMSFTLLDRFLGDAHSKICWTGFHFHSIICVCWFLYSPYVFSHDLLLLSLLSATFLPYFSFLLWCYLRVFLCTYMIASLGPLGIGAVSALLSIFFSYFLLLLLSFTVSTALFLYSLIYLPVNLRVCS